MGAPPAGPRESTGETAAPTRPRSLRGHAVATFATNIGAALLSLVNVLIVAWSLGAAGRGSVAFLIAVSSMTTWIASMGIQEANAVIGGSRSETIPCLATNSILWALALGGAGMLVVSALVAAVPAVGGPVPRQLLVLTLLFVPTGLLKLFLQFLLQSQYEFKVTNIAWLAGPSTTAVVNTLLVLSGRLTISAAIGVWIAGQTLSALWMALFVWRRYGLGRPDRALGREALSFGLKAHVGHLATMGNYRADQWILGAIAGARELGHYSIAVAWAELLFYVPGVISLLLRPDVVRADRVHAVAIIGRSVRRCLLLSMLGAGMLIVAAPALCVDVFGPQFQGSIDDLRVLALGGIPIAVLVMLSNAMIAQRRPLLAGSGDGSALVVTLALDILLIPVLGGLGAAIATTAAYLVGSLVLTVVFVRLLGGRARDFVPRPGDVAWYSRQAGALAAALPRRGVLG